jgi:hypothetical protein
MTAPDAVLRCDECPHIVAHHNHESCGVCDCTRTEAGLLYDAAAALSSRVQALEAYVLKAKNWFDHFGADAPIVFGGEAEMSEEARALLGGER